MLDVTKVRCYLVHFSFEKTNNLGPTQTGLYSHRSRLEALKCTILVTSNENIGADQLFSNTFADCLFSGALAHIYLSIY